jgi:hypothetical protein
MIERTYRVSDVVNEEFLRFPLTLLANPKYREMSLEAKFIYSLLLNRLTLSQKNNWINEDNEVYLIYTREDAANTLNITYRKAISAFKELIEVGLLFEQRQGRGFPNLLYVLKAELADEDALEFGKQFDNSDDENDEKKPTNPINIQTCSFRSSRTAESAYLKLQNPLIKKCNNVTARTAESAHQDIPNLHSKKINNKKTESIYMENSQSVNQSYGNFCGIGVPQITDGHTDDEEIIKFILDRCELHLFKDNIQQMLIQAVERLYYSESLKIGNAKLPQQKVRSYLNLLDCDTLISTVESMKANEDRIKNPMAYIMSTIINTICEKESDLILSLPAQYVSQEDLYAPADYSSYASEGDDEDGNFYESGPTGDFGFTKSIRSSS